MKKFLSLLMAAALIASLCVPAMAASGFSDVPASHWAYTEIQEAAASGITSGYADGTFRPAGTVTNAQFAVMLSRAFYPNDIAGNQAGGQAWYWANLKTLYDRGLLSGTAMADSGSWAAKSGNSISRYDMAQMMCAILTANGRTAGTGEKTAAQSKITDWGRIPAGYQDAVAACYALGILNGQSDGSFGGTSPMNRAQGCVVIGRLSRYLKGGKAQETSAAQTGGQIGGLTFDPARNITVAQPSTGIWTGWQGRAYGAEVTSEAEVPQVLQRCMDGYPSSVVFFSQRQLTLDRNALLAQYEISHGLHTRVKAVCYDTTCFVPKGTTGTYYRNTAGNYYEYRIDLHYDAAGFVRMYREGIIDSLPTTADFSFTQDQPADYSLLLNAVEEVERTYGVSVNSSDYDKALACYRWLTENITYDHYMAALEGNDLVTYFDTVVYPEEINFALTYRKGVCFEYALLYQALCCAMKVNCFVVTGIAGSQHAWNMVEIDGQWYQADATWDAGDPPDRYQYFLVSDAVMRSRTIDDYYYQLPACPTSYSR